MRIVMMLSALMLIPIVGNAQNYVCLQFQSTRDSIAFSPVENVKVASVYKYPYHYQVSDVDGKYCFYLQDITDLKLNYFFEHPYVTFPDQSLLEFPYELKEGLLTFFINGVPLPKNHKTILTYNGPDVKKPAKAKVTLRSLPENDNDSLILLDLENNYLGSFETSKTSEIHYLHDVDYEDVLLGGGIVNLNSGDTTTFGFNEWLNIIPEVQFHPVQRAQSEFETLREFYRFTREVQIKHNEEIDSLKKEITQLKDSIHKIQNPRRWANLHSGLIYTPSTGIIDGVFIRDTISFSKPNFPQELEQNIIDIIKHFNPKRSGVITIELTIDNHGKAHAAPLAHSKDLQEVQKAICHYLSQLETDVYSISGENFPWIQTFDIGIYPEQH